LRAPSGSCRRSISGFPPISTPSAPLSAWLRVAPFPRCSSGVSRRVPGFPRSLILRPFRLADLRVASNPDPSGVAGARSPGRPESPRFRPASLWVPGSVCLGCPSRTSPHTSPTGVASKVSPRCRGFCSHWRNRRPCSRVSPDSSALQRPGYVAPGCPEPPFPWRQRWSSRSPCISISGPFRLCVSRLPFPLQATVVDDESRFYSNFASLGLAADESSCPIGSRSL